MLPDGTSVASYVHEYGGGACLATNTDAWFCNATDQRIYRATANGVVPVTSEAGVTDSLRYADLRLSPDRQGLAVRERHEHGAVINELV